MKLSILMDKRFKDAMIKLNQQQVPLKAAFKFKEIIDLVDKEIKKYDDARLAALNKYGQKNDDNTLSLDEVGNVKLDTNGIQSFVQDINTLLSSEVEIPTISSTELGDNFKMSSEELFLLDFITQ